MNLTYFEPATEGHCAFWAQAILERASGDPRLSSVRLVASPGLIARLGADLPAGVDIRALEPRDLADLTEGSLAARGMAQWRFARQLLRESGGGLCFLPFFDHALIGACLDRRPVPGQIAGVIFRPPNFYGQRPGLRGLLDAGRRWAMYLASWRAGCKLFTLDDAACESWIGRATGRLDFLPDPAPDLAVLQQARARPPVPGRHTCLLFGSLARRKGVLQILAALPLMPRAARQKLHLRLMGKVLAADAAKIETALDQARNDAPEVKITLEDRFLTDQELAAEVMGADAILAPYQNHVGSSGVLYWAAAAGKPVISQNTGLMGQQVQRYGLGLALDSTNPATLAKAMETVPRVDREGVAEYIRLHTKESFSRILLDSYSMGKNT